MENEIRKLFSPKMKIFLAGDELKESDEILKDAKTVAIVRIDKTSDGKYYAVVMSNLIALFVAGGRIIKRESDHFENDLDVIGFSWIRGDKFYTDGIVRELAGSTGSMIQKGPEMDFLDLLSKRAQSK